MRYVILRDDDTNALTPVDCLERLYRPFLDRNLPVNLATIPEVATNTTFPDGRPEGYLVAMNGTHSELVPIMANWELIDYLRGNPGFHIVQHGCRHDWFEFDRNDRLEIEFRLERGGQLLQQAGFPRPNTFVAPYDKFSRTSLAAAARRFAVISSGWYEWRRVPARWWPRYVLKKIRGVPHWKAGGAKLLSHPGCLLSRHRARATMLQEVKRAVQQQSLTVLVTHWWEYFPDNRPDKDFIRQLHQVAEYLAGAPDVRVIAFKDLAEANPFW